jgi:hypothetical protein
MLSWVHWFNRPEGHAIAFRAPNVIMFLVFAQRLTQEDRHFLKKLRIASS